MHVGHNCQIKCQQAAYLNLVQATAALLCYNECVGAQQQGLPSLLYTRVLLSQLVQSITVVLWWDPSVTTPSQQRCVAGVGAEGPPVPDAAATCAQP